MRLTPLFDYEILYTHLEFLDYGAGGQLYGTLEGTVTGEMLRGKLHLTNFAVKRPDDVNVPTLRGILTTDDGARVYVEINGIAIARPADGARIVTASLTFRTGDSRYAWLNTAFAVSEGVLDSVATGGIVRNRAYLCEASVTKQDFAAAE